MKIISIRNKILFYMLLPILFTMLLWSYFAYQTVKKSYQNEIASLFFEILDSASHRVKLYLSNEIDKLDILARNPTLQKYVERAVDKYAGKTPEDNQRYFAEMDDIWARGKKDEITTSYLTNIASQVLRDFQMYEKLTYREIFVTDEKGGLVASTNKTTDFYQADEEWWRSVMASKGKVYLGDIEFDESAQAHSIALGIPIRKGRLGGAKIIGVMKVVVDVNQIFQVGSEFHVGKTGSIRVVNSEGKTVFDPNREFVESDEKSEIADRMSEKSKGYLKDESEGFERFVVFRSANLEDLMGREVVTQNRWSFCLAQDSSETFEPLNKTLRLIVIRNSIVTMILLFGTFILARHFTKPLGRLVQHTREIALGNFHKRIDVRTNDEFRELGQAFNQMVERLERFFELTESSERRYKTLFESAKEGILVLEHETQVIVNANLAFVSSVGKSKEEVVGKKATIFLSEMAPDLEPEAGLKVLMGESDQSEIVFTMRENQKKIFEVSSNRFVLDKLNFVQCFLRDVTEKKQIEQVKNNLIRDVAHELRTPVAKLHISLNILSDLLGKLLAGNERVHSLNQILQKSIERLSSTIESILDFSKLQEGIVYLEKEKFDLGQFLNEILLHYQDLVKEKGLQIEFNQVGAPILIEGDRRLLKMAVGNLISNAIKFTPAGKIVVNVFQTRGRIQVWVQDSGIGISPENLPQIFDKFYQVSPSIPGCGIGLAISDEIIKLHGGKIWAESGGLGKGSTFKLEFANA